MQLNQPERNDAYLYPKVSELSDTSLLSDSSHANINLTIKPQDFFPVGSETSIKAYFHCIFPEIPKSRSKILDIRDNSRLSLPGRQ